MLEKHFQGGVIKLAQSLGWMVAHFRPSLNRSGRWQTAVSGDGAGFPDLVLVHEKTGAVLFAELKRDSGKLTPEQERWRAALSKDGGRHCIWRPKDLELIRDLLARPRDLLLAEPCGHL